MWAHCTRKKTYGDEDNKDAQNFAERLKKGDTRRVLDLSGAPTGGAGVGPKRLSGERGARSCLYQARCPALPVRNRWTKRRWFEIESTKNWSIRRWIGVVSSAATARLRSFDSFVRRAGGPEAHGWRKHEQHCLITFHGGSSWRQLMAAVRQAIDFNEAVNLLLSDRAVRGRRTAEINGDSKAPAGPP